MDFGSMNECEKNQMALTLAALILTDDKADVTTESLSKVVEAAKVKVPVYLPMIFSKALEGKSITQLTAPAACASSAPAAAAAASSGAAPVDKKAKVEEPEEEVDFDMGDMFG